MIVREENEIRVVPDEWRVRLGSVAIMGLGVAIAVIFSVSAVESRRFQALAASAVVLVVAAVITNRHQGRREVFVIRLREIGYTAGKKLRWLSRGAFREVDVHLGESGAEVLFLRADGTRVGIAPVEQVYIKDLREALSEAGYDV